MSRIDEMIKELCPEGVEVHPLGEVCEILRGKRVTKSDIKPQGTYPVISGGITPMGYMEDYNREPNTITVSQYGTAGYVDFQKVKFWANDICYCLYPKQNLKNEFLWYVLKNKQDYLYEIRNTDATPFSLPSDTLKSVDIPLPPLTIQQEIVSVLDKFTTLIDKMKQEMEKRKKQMEYYREKLLTFEDGECEWKTLGEATIISRGKRVVRKDLLENGSIPVYQNSLKPLGFANESNYPANTPFIISAGAAGEVGYSHIDYWGADDCFSILCKDTNNRYIYHWLKIKELFLQSRIRGGAIKRLSRDIVDNLPVPVVPTKRQQEIASTLDKFESYITKLEKMITLRQKQYEYYREKLLTFQ